MLENSPSLHVYDNIYILKKYKKCDGFNELPHLSLSYIICRRAGTETKSHSVQLILKKLKLNSEALLRERTIPTERPPPVGEVSANFCG